jgi:uncharacterized protein (DUF362 family)
VTRRKAKNGAIGYHAEVTPMPKTSRRQFLRDTLAVGVALPLIQRRPAPSSAVAIARCRTYGDAEVRAALATCFDQLGGLDRLVRNKTITLKVNLTGQSFSPFMNRPTGETYMTHFATVYHFSALLFGAGARRVRVVESTGRRAPLEATLTEAGWDLTALGALGTVVYEDTRNRGSASTYAHLVVPHGRMFSAFDLNRAYEETDVMVSLAKLKQHITAGVTLSMKNMFGLTPSSMYGGKAGDEDATAGRGAIHDPRRYVDLELPGLKTDFLSTEAGVRVPNTIVDLCAARPVDLAIIDGITSITQAESRYFQDSSMRVVSPGVIIAGTNAVSVDAVGAAVMGFDPRAARGSLPFARCENHLLLAESAGLGTADLSRIDVRGLAVADARCPYVI